MITQKQPVVNTNRIIAQTQCVEMELAEKKPTRSLIRTSISTVPRGRINTFAKQQPSMGVDMRIKKSNMIKTVVPRSHNWEKTYISQVDALIKKDLTPFLDSINFDTLASSVIDSAKPRASDIAKTPVTTRGKAKFVAFRSLQASLA